MKHFLRQNGLLLLIIALLLSVLIGIVSAVMGGNADPLSNAVGFITTPIRNGVSAVLDWADGVRAYVFHYEEMEQQIQDLERQVAELEEQAREGAAASRENERLRNLIGLAEKRKELTFESATVTAHGTSNWYSTFTISKGSNADIAVDDCVLDDYGNLVGVVAEIGTNWAEVRTVVDAEIQMGALLARTDEAAVLEGDFSLMGEGRLKLTYLPDSTELIAGDQVLTLSREGIYPSGLVVGHIEEVHTEASGMTRYAVIVPEADLDSLKQVFVIKDFDIVE